MWELKCMKTNTCSPHTQLSCFHQPLHSIYAALAVAMLSSACGGGGGGAAAPTNPVFGQNGSVDVNVVTMEAGQTCNIARFPQELLAHINAVRVAGQNCGGTLMAPAAPLTWNTLITQAAAMHSLASKNFYSHTGTDGGGVFDRFAAVGYEHNDAGEILLAGTTKIPDAMNSFLRSPSHCSYLMRPDYKEVGGACVYNAASRFKHYLTVDFGS